MKKIVSFMQWEFSGCSVYLKSLGFWSVVVAIMSFVMWLAGCPAPWPQYTVALAFGMFFVDTLYAYIRFRVSMYHMDQESKLRTLGKQ